MKWGPAHASSCGPRRRRGGGLLAQPREAGQAAAGLRRWDTDGVYEHLLRLRGSIDKERGVVFTELIVSDLGEEPPSLGVVDEGGEVPVLPRERGLDGVVQVPPEAQPGTVGEHPPSSPHIGTTLEELRVAIPELRLDEFDHGVVEWFL